MPFSHQSFCIIPVQCFSFALAIGAVITPVLHAFIGFQSAPTQAIEDVFFGAGYITALIGVFDAEKGLAAEAEADLRELLAIPAQYKVLFLQGGASGQFAAIPMNLAAAESTVDYVNTGNWSGRPDAGDQSTTTCASLA